MTAEPAARQAALTPPRAYGAPVASAQLRAAAEDFRVEEDLGFTAAGSGAHILLRVRKVDANTQWVARELARAAHCRPDEVGYAGLKDRRAVALQWFSVPQPRLPCDWSAVRGTGFEVLEAHPHTRKLPRGALAGNRFAIRLRPAATCGAGLAEALAPRLELIARHGVPNYFGPQRFGRDGANLERRGPRLRWLKPSERGFVLSAARGVIFNAVLAARVTALSWQQLLPGDVANLDGRGSIFPVEAVDESLVRRCQALEIHPTGPLWGEGDPQVQGAVRELEAAVAADFPGESELCTQARMRQERRSLRLAVHELWAQTEEAAVVLHFRLGRGSFATAVLRELIEAPAEVPDA